MKKISIENNCSTKGFTMIEMLISVAFIAILAAVVFVAVKPSQRLAKARNNQRQADIAVILNAIGQRAGDYRGVFETSCAAGVIPTTSTPMASSVGSYNIGPCLVPTYVVQLPFDTKAPGGHYTSTTDYTTGYNISRDATTGRIAITAPYAEVGDVISSTR